MVWDKLSDAIDASKRSVETISYDSNVSVVEIARLVERKPVCLDSICRLAKVLNIGAFDLLGLDAFSPDMTDLIDDALAEYEKTLRAKLAEPGRIDEDIVKRINNIVELRMKMSNKDLDD